MDNKNLMPQQAQPVNRIATGQLPSELMELSEEALQLLGGDSGSSDQREALQPAFAIFAGFDLCSYDGDDAE